jgi:hypothetical protein
LDNSFISHVQTCTNIQYGFERINTNIWITWCYKKIVP